MTEGKKRLVVVVPCYNEEEVLPETGKRLNDVVERLVEAGKIHDGSSICFVDDGSRDRTWRTIEDLSLRLPRVGGLRLSRNRGHQNALMAGLFQTDADWTITIDADLQDDVEAIPRMVDAALEGVDIVYGVRRERAVDTRLKRVSARGYYRTLAALGVEIVYDHADFRLMSRRAVDALKPVSYTHLTLPTN